MVKAAITAGAVVLIAAVLIASAVFGEIRCKVDPARIHLLKIAMAVDTYTLDTGELPADLRQLLSADIAGWDGPYLRQRELLDPWGEPVIYRVAVADPSRFVLAMIPPERQARDGENLTLYRQAVRSH